MTRSSSERSCFLFLVHNMNTVYTGLLKLCNMVLIVDMVRYKCYHELYNQTYTGILNAFLV